MENEIQEHELQQERKGDGVSEPSASTTSSEQLDKLQAERDTLIDRLARLQAEFENARKRSQKEQADFRDYALADFAKQFLPILDSFDRAINTDTGEEDLRKGIELIRRQMEDALTKIGVKTVPAKGEQFDPRVHEAIEMIESRDAKENEVIDELQRGYKIKDRLLRPAMVRVAKNHK